MRRVLAALPIAVFVMILFGSTAARAHNVAAPLPENLSCSYSASMVRGDPGQNPLDLRVKWEVTAPANISAINTSMKFAERPNGPVYMGWSRTQYPGTSKTESGYLDFRVDNVNAAHAGWIDIAAFLVDGRACYRTLQIRIAANP